MATEDPHSQDHMTFGMLLRLSFCPMFKQTLIPHDMDKLGVEIAMALQRCSVPECQVSERERKINEHLVSGITTFANYLKNRADDTDVNGDGRAGAFHLLFRKTVITSANTQCLFRMCDATVRTGYIRQQALMILALFSDLSSSCWKLKFPAETAGDPPVSYARRQIAVMADALAQKALQGTECTRLLLTALFNGLMRPIGSESPKDIIELVNKFDWPKILQDKDVNAIQDKATKIYYDYSIFILLHAWACRLLAKDVENEMAKTFIREHLGSCTKLLQTCLRRIIHEGVQMGREIENLAIVVIDFMNCLVPVPIDRETIALVRRAKSALEQALLRNKTSDDPFLMENIALGTYNFKGQRIKTLIYNMSVWQQAHYLSDEKRWYYFHDFFLSGGNTLAADRRLVKDARKSCKKKVKLVAGLQDGEMCANCFVLEKTLLKEQEEYDDEGGGNNSNSNDGGLMKCSRCLQIKYCSRECQGEHWKKAHKLHCKSIKTAKLPSSSLSKKS